MQQPSLLQVLTKQILKGMDVEDARQIVIRHYRPVGPRSVLDLELIEREMIFKAMHRHNCKARRAAKSIGMTPTTMYRKLKRFGWKFDG